MTLLAVLVAGLVLTHPVPAITGPADRVTDGDTLVVDGVTIRLFGIDAPERGRPGSRIAADLLIATVDGQTLACDPVEVDRYGRTVAICRIGGVDIAPTLLESRWVREYLTYSCGYYGGPVPDTPRCRGR